MGRLRTARDLERTEMRVVSVRRGRRRGVRRRARPRGGRRRGRAGRTLSETHAEAVNEDQGLLVLGRVLPRGPPLGHLDEVPRPLVVALLEAARHGDAHDALLEEEDDEVQEERPARDADRVEREAERLDVGVAAGREDVCGAGPASARESVSTTEREEGEGERKEGRTGRARGSGARARAGPPRRSPRSSSSSP